MDLDVLADSGLQVLHATKHATANSYHPALSASRFAKWETARGADFGVGSRILNILRILRRPRDFVVSVTEYARQSNGRLRVAY